MSGDPIFNATVKITDGITQVNTTTGNDGSFSTSFPLSQDKELTIVYFKTGYDTDTTTVYVPVSATIEVPVLKLTQQQGTGGGTSSGQAATIISLFSVSSKHGCKGKRC